MWASNASRPSSSGNEASLVNFTVNGQEMDYLTHYNDSGLFANETSSEASATEFAALDVSCPTYTPYNDYVINMISFWLEGVIQSSVCIVGLFGNLISAIILSR